jgi:outer membrane protein OmpA-like peptidoglycan-associated protein
MAAEPTRRRVRNPIVPVLVTIVGLLAIVLAQTIPNRHSIEEDLTSRSERALRGAGLSTVDVEFVGRDGTVYADSEADAGRALAIVRAQEGVRVARAEVANAPRPGGSQASKLPPSVNVSLNGGRVVLTGTVPSTSARTLLVDSIARLFGSGAVDDRLTASADVTDAGLAGLPGVVGALGKDVDNASVELRDGKLTLTGTVPNTTIKDAAIRAAAQAMGNQSAVVDRLAVAPPGGPSQDVQTQLAALPQVTFANDSASLTAQGQASVARAAEILRANPSVRVRIEGHTDGNGTPEANQALSEARARSVVNALTALGIAADRLSSTGFGESRPRVPDTSAANMALNRRVEFVVVV